MEKKKKDNRLLVLKCHQTNQPTVRMITGCLQKRMSQTEIREDEREEVLISFCNWICSFLGKTSFRKVQLHKEIHT